MGDPANLRTNGILTEDTARAILQDNDDWGGPAFVEEAQEAIAIARRALGVVHAAYTMFHSAIDPTLDPPGCLLCTALWHFEQGDLEGE